MPLLLDTNVVSAARRPERQSEAFRHFLRHVELGACFLSAVTILEIEFGIAREAVRKEAFAADLHRWLEGQVLARFANRILSFDTACARASGALPILQQRPGADAMIAGTAQVHGLMVATRNVGDFAPLGVPLVDPWTASP